MTNQKSLIRDFLLLPALLTLAAILSFGLVASAQTSASQGNDRDVTRGELASFDRFMDSHPEVAEQLRKDPSLVNNKEFVENHQALQEYLQQHPEVREEISENPNRFMHQEDRFDQREDQRGDRRDDDVTRRELANFDRFMDSHPEVAEQLRKDPSLVNNKEFVENHQALQEYLQQHPEVREEISENPNRFMHQEDRFDQQEDRRADRRNDRNDDDVTRRELANFDRFMDSHPEISEQLRKDPSLVNNKEFVENHSALRDYLQQHPEVREEISENPSRFMYQEDRFDRQEDRQSDQRGDRRDNDVTRGELANFDRFMDSHPEISEQLRKDPSLVNNKEFVENHPAVRDYLQQHPEVREEISENPNGFMHQEDRFDHREDQRADRRDDHRDHDFDRGETEGFGRFLGEHSGVASQLSKNPSLANNQEFMESHPELQQYLKEHPEAQKQLTANPQSFIQSAQQFTNSTSAPKTPVLNPMPKQQK